MTETTSEHKKRKLTTSWKVALSDKIARQVITIGGLATIAAVLLVVFVLFSNVVPLFRETTIDAQPLIVNLPASANQSESSILHSGVDEFAEIAWFLDSAGNVSMVAIHDGAILASFPNEATENTPKISASYRDRGGHQVLLGFEDGKVQIVELKFETSFIKESDIEDSIAEALSKLESNTKLITSGDSIYRQLSGQLIRRQRLSQVVRTELHAAMEDGSAITLVSATPAEITSSFDQSTATKFIAISKTGIASGTLAKKVHQFTGAELFEWTSSFGALPNNVEATSISSAMVHQQGNLATTCLRDGRLAKWRLSESAPELIELTTAVNRSPQKLSADVSVAAPLLGDNTLLVGTGSGHVIGTFLADGVNESGEQGQHYYAAHPFKISDAKIESIASSPGSRMFAAVDEKSALSLCYAPNDAVLTQKQLDISDIHEMWFSPKQDKLGILAQGQLRLYGLEVTYPEASFKSFFQPMWYEGYSEPVSVWQSTSAGVDAEPKLSMRPLIFGTLKATFYSLLIAVPLAVMAAVYSSEFLSRSVRLRVKPAIELMAGIPSVVLGFIAALVLASLFREHLFAILLSFFTLIFTLGLVGNLWLLLPQQVYLRMEQYRTLILLFVVPTGISLAWLISRPIESLLFGQTLIWWLDAKEAPAWPGWFLLLLPICMVGIVYASSTIGTSFLRPYAARTSAKTFAAMMVVRYLLTTLAVLLSAWILALLLSSIGFDARGTIYGSYQERNALLVGAILGFAIIPIIYTIAEDALQAVPQHLRSASLGCGATPWQTTTRIVLPTAMSGLFGGVMIGFGRAVGETMVVLMAAGNTPVMDVNPFNGYRTLSATLATELPEAARASTHFHTLFLAAFLLFCFTLVANTLAEFVRMRFRKRSFQL